jgi:hypothetical protein
MGGATGTHLLHQCGGNCCEQALRGEHVIKVWVGKRQMQGRERKKGGGRVTILRGILLVPSALHSLLDGLRWP